MKPKILIIEDDAAISELLCMNLEAADYLPLPVYDGSQAVRILETEGDSFALALVDVMLPGKSGFALMDDLKKAGIPAIYLTAKSDVDSRVFGLKSGAEDYIVKPFALPEVLIRMEKVLERTGRGRERMQIRDVCISLSSRQVTKNQLPVPLKPLEYELLVTLAKGRNRAFSREELLHQVWGADYVGETRTVDVHIGQLRPKLDFYDVIRTLPKLGYRLEDQP